MSFLIDLHIILKTVRVVLCGHERSRSVEVQGTVHATVIENAR